MRPVRCCAGPACRVGVSGGVCVRGQPTAGSLLCVCPPATPGHTLTSTPQAHTDSLNTLVALHQLYQYTQKYYDEVRAVLPGVAAPGPWVPAAV